MLINGIPGNVVDVSDRGFIYGDGIFETIRIINHQLTLWDLHLNRLITNCKILAIPIDPALLQIDVRKVLSANSATGILKIIITRGTGGRGYKPISTDSTRIVQFHQLPDTYAKNRFEGVKVKICSYPVSSNSRLGGIKHLGRLDQVMASIELTEEFAEGVMLSDTGLVIEGTKTNLFAVIANQLITPCLASAGIKGVMREYLIKRFFEAGFEVRSVDLTTNHLLQATEIFLCNSVLGVWPVRELVHSEGKQLLESGPFSRLAIGFQDDEFSRYE